MSNNINIVSNGNRIGGAKPLDTEGALHFAQKKLSIVPKDGGPAS